MDRVLSQFEEVTAVSTATPGAAAWTAREPGGRRVLIKRLRGDGGKTRATQSLALQHPRIVPTRRWLRDNEAFYVVRDWVPGRNLRQALENVTHRAFDRLQALLGPVLDALEYAHDAGLPHGGVTPENVLVVDEGPVGGETVLCDFATVDNAAGAHLQYVPRSLLTPDGQPTPRADFFALCELYKEFLPQRPGDDEAGAAARTRLLRNLTETGQTAGSAEELRYKLDAVGKMADLLGFSSSALAGDRGSARRGARLVCAVTPPTAVFSAGGSGTVVLSVHNEGDAPLQVQEIRSDVVWLNVPPRAAPFALAPDAARDVVLALSGARLEPGTHQATLRLRSNDGLLEREPARGERWPEQAVTVPVLVSGAPAVPPPAEPREAPATPPETEGDLPAIACVQEPDPGLVRYGQSGVVHVGIRNLGRQRLRLDKVRPRPSWLVYPGTFQALWIEPGAVQYVGLSIQAATLTGGDYKAEVLLTVSTLWETPLNIQPIWRELPCEVRVRVVRDVPPGMSDPKGAGCAPLLLALASSLWLLVLVLLRLI